MDDITIFLIENLTHFNEMTTHVKVQYNKNSLSYLTDSQETLPLTGTWVMAYCACALLV